MWMFIYIETKGHVYKNTSYVKLSQTHKSRLCSFPNNGEFSGFLYGVLTQTLEIFVFI